MLQSFMLTVRNILNPAVIEISKIPVNEKQLK